MSSFFLACCIVAGQTVPSSSAATPLRLTKAIGTFNVDELTTLAHTARQLSHRDLASGVLLSWSGGTERGSVALRHALSGTAPLSQLERDEAGFYLALDEGLDGNYLQASEDARLFLQEQQILTGTDLTDFSNQLELWKRLSHQPPVQVDLPGPSEIPLVSNSTQRIEGFVQSGEQRFIALFDTGAEITVVSRTTLKRLGIRPLQGRVHDASSSGLQMTTTLAMLPELRLGSVVAHNVPAMIERDDDLVVGPPQHRTKIDFIVGESLLRRLETFGVERTGIVAFNQPAARLQCSARLLEVGPTLVVNAAVQGMPFNLLLDTGATTTILTKSFYEAHEALFPPSSRTSQNITGVGGSTKVDRFNLPNLNVTLERGELRLHDLSVFPRRSALDVRGLVGNGGRDIWNGTGPFQINYRQHSLAFEESVSASDFKQCSSHFNKILSQR